MISLFSVATVSKLGQPPACGGYTGLLREATAAGTAPQSSSLPERNTSPMAAPLTETVSLSMFCESTPPLRTAVIEVTTAPAGTKLGGSWRMPSIQAPEKLHVLTNTQSSVSPSVSKLIKTLALSVRSLKSNWETISRSGTGRVSLAVRELVAVTMRPLLEEKSCLQRLSSEAMLSSPVARVLSRGT